MNNIYIFVYIYTNSNETYKQVINFDEGTYLFKADTLESRKINFGTMKKQLTGRKVYYCDIGNLPL